MTNPHTNPVKQARSSLCRDEETEMSSGAVTSPSSPSPGTSVSNTLNCTCIQAVSTALPFQPNSPKGASSCVHCFLSHLPLCCGLLSAFSLCRGSSPKGISELMVYPTAFPQRSLPSPSVAPGVAGHTPLPTPHMWRSSPTPTTHCSSFHPHPDRSFHVSLVILKDLRTQLKLATRGL